MLAVLMWYHKTSQAYRIMELPLNIYFLTKVIKKKVCIGYQWHCSLSSLHCYSLSFIFYLCSKRGNNLSETAFKFVIPNLKWTLQTTSHDFIKLLALNRKSISEHIAASSTDKRTDDWSRPSCIYTQIFSPKKT